MTTKMSEDSVFLKIELSPEIKAQFSKVCTFYEMSMSRTMQILVLEWIEEFNVKHPGKLEAIQARRFKSRSA